MFTFGSLFAGIGGLDLGLERAGMTCTWQVEIDPFCLKVLAKHWPDVPKYEDVRNVGKHNLKSVDLICGGFPCQPHSVAGKQKGAADDRNLWPEFLRVIREVRPTFILAENVPGIVSLYLDTVLSDLEGEAYTCWTFNIPACAFDAPHLRKRIFVVAHSDNCGFGKLFQPEQERGRQEAPDIGRDGEAWALAHAEGKRTPATEQPGQPHRIKQGCEDMADANSINGWARARRRNGAQADNGCQGMADANGQQAVGATISWEERDPWKFEPDVGRVAHGVPHRVDRLKALGNAVVPQIAEWIGRQIMTTYQKENK